MVVKVTARELGGLATRDDECEMGVETCHYAITTRLLLAEFGSK
jgi:hypothetical protein